MIDESQHTYREVDPIYVIVEVTAENWDDVVAWTHAQVFELPDADDEQPYMFIPNGDFDDQYAAVGWWVVRNASQWVTYSAEDWGQPDDYGSMSSLFAKVVG